MFLLLYVLGVYLSLCESVGVCVPFNICLCFMFLVLLQICRNNH